VRNIQVDLFSEDPVWNRFDCSDRLRDRGRAALQGGVTNEARWASAPVVALGFALGLKPVSKAA
jgi:hypothetical protein